MSKRKIIRAAILIAALITSITCGTAVAQDADHLKETIQTIPDAELINTDLKNAASQELNEQPASYELDPNLEKALSLVGITPEYPIWSDQQQELHT